MSGEAKDIIIRASSLDEYMDCGLRGAVSMWPDLFESRGFEVPRRKKHVGAGVGSGFHKGTAHIFTQVKQDKSPDLKEANEAGIAEFDHETEEGFMPDEVTPNKDVAYKQIGKMIKAYYGHVGYRIKPELVEDELEVDLNHLRTPQEAQRGINIKAVGHPDHTTTAAHLFNPQLKDGQRLVIDTKTGKMSRFYIGQIGTYQVQLRAADKPTEWGIVAYIRRVALDKEIGIPKITSYMPAVAERVAIAQFSRLLNDRRRFESTGNPYEFPINPGSFLCDPRYCKAWDSPICCVSKIKSKVQEKR